MSRFTDDQVMTTLRQVVAGNPAYVYEAPEGHRDDDGTCFYVHGHDEDARPGCLVGHVLHRLGVPLEDLRRWEGKGAYGVCAPLMPERAANAMCAAQGTQDWGDTWSYALSRAEAEHEGN